MAKKAKRVYSFRLSLERVEDINYIRAKMEGRNGPKMNTSMVLDKIIKSVRDYYEIGPPLL